jgi:hypothetical protein
LDNSNHGWEKRLAASISYDQHLKATGPVC